MDHELYLLGLEYYESAARLKDRIDALRRKGGFDNATRLSILYSEYLDAMHTARELVETYGEAVEEAAS